MKARGKFERASSAKRGKLLRVYATSLLSLLLCCTMFVGTTMAWFTDSISSQSQITAGELKLEVKFGGGNGTAVQTLSENSVLFEDVVWKPGHEATETLAVQNKGTLPFRYILKLEVKEDDCKDAEDKVLDKAARNALMEQYTVYLGEIGAASNKIGTLKDIIANKTELVDAVLEAPVAPEETNGKTYELKLVMDETAEIEFMGQSLGLVLKVDAYQEDTPDYVVGDIEPTIAGEDSGFPEGTNIYEFKDMNLTGDVPITVDKAIQVDMQNVTSNLTSDVIVLDVEGDNGAVFIQNSTFTIPEGKYLINSKYKAYQVFLVNVTVNGEPLTEENKAKYLNNVEWSQALQMETE